MNGDGGSDENGVDGQNISPNSVTTGDVKTTDLTFTVARQADTLFSASNYVLPITKPPEDGSTYALCNSVDGGGLFVTPSVNSTFAINLTTGANAQTVTVTFQPNATFSIDTVLGAINDAIARWFSSVFSPSRVVLSLNVASFPYSTDIFVSSAAASGQIINAGGTQHQVATFLGWPATSPAYAGVNTFTSPNTNTVTQIIEIDNLCIWKKIPTAYDGTTNKIMAYDGIASITCQDVGAIQSVGNVNYNDGNLSQVGSIAGTATCNITTNTTQIANGSSEIKLITDSVDRLVIDSIKSKMMCGVSTLQLSAVSDGLSEATTTYMGASVGPTQNTLSIYTPDQYQVIQNNGAVARIVVDTTSTNLYTKSYPAGPQASFLQLKDDGRFAIGSLGANNGLIDATLGNLAIIGAAATSAIELALSPPTITTSVFNGFARTTRQVIDQTANRLYDDAFNEKLRIDALGVTVNNAYSLPILDGTASQVLTTSGAGVTSWQTPQVYGLYSQTSTKTVANTNVETSLIGTGVGLGLTVPAGYFQNGYSFLYKTGGVFRDSSNGQLIRFRLRNSGVLFDSGNLSLSNVNTSRGWNIECQFTYYSGNIITNFSFSYTNGTNDAFGFTNQSTNAINNAVPNTLDFTVQWNTASVLNTISSNYGTLTKIF